MKPQKHIPKMWDGNENKAAQDMNWTPLAVYKMLSCTRVSYNRKRTLAQRSTKQKLHERATGDTGVKGLMKLDQESTSFIQ